MQFDALLERMPVWVSRRVELSALLYSLRELGWGVSRVRQLELEAREAVLYQLAPLVQASHSGARERAVFLELASLAAVPEQRATQLL